MSLTYRTTVLLGMVAGLLAVVILSADGPEDLLGPLALAPLAAGMYAGRWLYRRFGARRRLGGFRRGLDAIPRWVILLLAGPVFMGPAFIVGGADIAPAAVASLLFGPAVLVALIGWVLLSFWLLAGPAWLLGRLWPGSRFAAPRVSELKRFTRDMTVGFARDLRSR